MAYPIPAWRVTLDGKDLTQRMRPRLLELTLNEARGDDADELNIVLHDHDGKMDIPPTGAMLDVALGWQGQALVDKGSFMVDEVEHSGSPDIISIRARSANFTREMRVRAERSYHATTLGAVIKQIAARHGLKAKVGKKISGNHIKHLDQTNESDVHLLTRLAKRYDAVATVKANTLLFTSIGSGETADGTPLPDAHITRREGDKHRYSVASRDNYTGVRAYWSDKRGADQKSVLVGEAENARRLPGKYHSEQEAKEQAEAANNRIQRGKATLSFSLALGNPTLYPEQHVTVSGFKPQIDETDWLIAKTTHTIKPTSGYTTQLEMETAGEDGEGGE